MDFEPKIIFVEDDAGMRDFFRDSLMEEGYPVELASNGTEGLKKAGALKSHPLLVISDYMMPDMTGLEMIEKIKEFKPDDSSFIILTAYPEQEMMLESINIHIDGFVTKPFDFPDLLTRIEASLKGLKLSYFKYFDFLDGILSGFPYWLRVVDRDLNVIFKNNSLKKAFPMSGSRKCCDLWGIRERCEICVTSLAINSGKPHEKIIEKEGKTFKLTSYPFKNDYKNVPYAVEIIEDITELMVHKITIAEQARVISDSDKKIRDQFLQLVESEKLNILGILSSGIIHEINTPNTYIRGNMQIILKYSELLTPLLKKISARAEAEGSHEFMDEVSTIKRLFSDMEEMAKASLDGTSRIMGIVSSIRGFSRKDDAPLERVNIFSPLIDAARLTRGRQKTICAVYINDIPYNGEAADRFMEKFQHIVILGFAQRITQVFAILINNSLDAFEDEQGNPQRNRLDAGVKIDGDNVVVSFKDNAGGIPDKIKGEIFNPFFTTKGGARSMGLGLDILKKIVEDHNGFVSVASDTVKGETVFTLVFPLKQL